jgi:N-acetylglucosamine-6-sulfatase
VIMTDDQDDTGSLSTMPKTQALLADQGTHFSNSIVDYPLCCPSRASFLTGQAAHNHGVLHNRPPLGGYGVLVPTEDNTLPVWLQGAGYTTTHIGKYANGYGLETPVTHVPPGWNEWQGLPELSGGKSKYFDYGINENGVITMYGSDPEDYQTDVLTDKAVGFIGEQSGGASPFFLSLAPLAPHVASDNLFPVPAPRHAGTFDSLPLPQAPNFNEADVSDKPSFIQQIAPKDELLIAVATQSFRQRRETLLAVDDMVERVVQALADTDQLDETIIVFTSDNGFVHGEHRRTLGKSLVYEEDIQVPLLIRGPGIPKSEDRPQIVNNLDVVATIVEMADAVPGRTLDGRSLVELLRNSNESWRTAVLVQGTNGFPPTSSARMQAVRTANYVYAEHLSPDGLSTEYELYDLTADPYQLESQHNIPAFSSIQSSLQALLANLKTCAGQSCWFAGPAP